MFPPIVFYIFIFGTLGDYPKNASLFLFLFVGKLALKI